MMTAYVIIGVAAVLGGLALLVTAIRRHKEQHPKHVAMLIGGMMMTAFGLVIAGFAIAYQTAGPLNLNATSEPNP